MQEFTVIGYDTGSLDPIVKHLNADNGEHAAALARTLTTDLYVLAVLEGHHDTVYIG